MRSWLHTELMYPLIITGIGILKIPESYEFMYQKYGCMYLWFQWIRTTVSVHFLEWSCGSVIKKIRTQNLKSFHFLQFSCTLYINPGEIILFGYYDTPLHTLSTIYLIWCFLKFCIYFVSLHVSYSFGRRYLKVQNIIGLET